MSNDNTKPESNETEQQEVFNMLLMLGETYHKLMQFKRFQTFLSLNYNIGYPEDEKNPGFVDVVVEEKSQEAVQVQLNELMKDAKGRIIQVNEAAMKDLPKIIL